MKSLSRWLFAAMATVLCAGMWGCTDVDFQWYEHRSKAKVVGFIDDSLVMVGDYRCWSEITDRWNGEYVELEGCGAERLCAYNYRVQENGPKLCDSLSSEFATGMFGMKNQGSSTPAWQMTDSIIWAIRSSNSITLWKIGEGVHDFELSKSFNGCYGDFRINSIKQWFDGKFIVRGEKSLNAGGDTCQYAVLDTVARTLVYKRLEENLKWIEKCDDVRAWEDGVYCFMPGEHAFEAVLLRNGDVVDVPVKFTIGDFWGDVLRPNADLCSLVDGCVVCTGIEWRGDGVKFYQDNVIVVEY